MKRSAGSCLFFLLLLALTACAASTPVPTATPRPAASPTAAARLRFIEFYSPF